MLENPALGRYFPTFGFEQSGIWLSDNYIGGLLTKCLKIPPWGGIFQRLGLNKVAFGFRICLE